MGLLELINRDNWNEQKSISKEGAERRGEEQIGEERRGEEWRGQMDGWMDAITETGEVREGGELAWAPRANVCVIEAIPRCTNALSFALTRTHAHRHFIRAVSLTTA